ncbi:MAG: cbb3-type cytochrome oxidase assembly protein CcoS [Idiomarina sp.]|nr:cbb3-type cytochrome oxidase assembly protein CcoS [Idiomarina sp.]
MEYLHIMVPVAILLVIAFIAVFYWAVKSGQFDDLERQGFNVLLDDDVKPSEQKKQQDTKSSDESN